MTRRKKKKVRVIREICVQLNVHQARQEKLGKRVNARDACKGRLPPHSRLTPTHYNLVTPKAYHKK